MAVDNSFHFIGVCYGDCKKVLKKNKGDEYFTKGIIVTKNSFSSKVHYIPIIFVKKLCLKSTMFCRNGNLISVSGEVASHERLDRLKGTTTIELAFLANDIMLIKKAYKQRLSSKEFSDLISNFSPDEYEPEVSQDGKQNHS